MKYIEVEAFEFSFKHIQIKYGTPTTTWLFIEM